jgi:AcrR family transcriptional regulator
MTETEPNRREDILQAALRTFAKFGFHKATIKQIADEAGLKSPALIYWYFKDKRELLQAVILELSPMLGWVTDADAAILDLPPQEILPRIAGGFFNVIMRPDASQLVRVFLSEVIHTPENVLPIMEGVQGAVLRFLVGYFQRQIELGNLRPHDPQASARAFMGMLLAYLLSRELFPPLAVGLPEINHYREEIVKIFLDGLRAI